MREKKPLSNSKPQTFIYIMRKTNPTIIKLIITGEMECKANSVFLYSAFKALNIHFLYVIHFTNSQTIHSIPR